MDQRRICVEQDVGKAKLTAARVDFGSAILRPPSFADALVSRSALIERLVHLSRRIILFLGPPGSGKTTTMTLLHNALKEQERPVYWLTLRPEDNDLATLQRHMDELVQQSESCVFDGEGAWLFRTVFMIDGLEKLSSPGARRYVESFALDLPEGYSICLTEHRLQGAQLHDGLLRGLVHLVEPAVLRLDDSEAGAILGIEWADWEIAYLNRFVDGWAAGLRFLSREPVLARNLLNEAADKAGLPTAMVDFFDEVVCANIEPAVLVALMDLSALDRFSPEVLACLPAPGYGWAEIERLICDCAFIRYTDATREWVSFHPAFGQHLRQKLRHRNPQRFQALRTFTATWFAENGYAADAVRHAVSISDKPSAARIIEQAGAIAVDVGHGPDEGLDMTIPPERAGELPLLFLAQIYDRIRHGRYEQARAAFGAALRKTEDFTRIDEHAKLPVVAAWADNLHLVFCSIDDIRAPAELLARLENAVRVFLDSEPVLVASTASVLAFVYVERSQFEEAARVCRIGLQMQEDDNAFKIAIFVDLHYASCLIATNPLADAITHAQRALDFAREEFAADSYELLSAYLMRGILHYECNELEEARECLLPALMRLRSINGWMWLFAESYVAAASVMARLEGMEAAEAQIRAGEALAQERDLPRLMRYMVVARANELIRVRDLHSASAVLEVPLIGNLLSDQSSEPEVLAQKTLVLLATTRLMLELSRIGEAQRTLDQIDLSFIEIADARIRFSYLALAMRCAFALRRYKKALEHAHAVVEIAAQRGFFRRALDNAFYIIEVINWAKRTDRKVSAFVLDYVQAVLLRESASETQVKSASSMLSRPQMSPADNLTLSPRESQIMTLVAEGLSTKEIARSLDISEGTVKSHRKKIHEKLGVFTRSQAIMRARDLLII